MQASTHLISWNWFCSWSHSVCVHVHACSCSYTPKAFNNCLCERNQKWPIKQVLCTVYCLLFAVKKFHVLFTFIPKNFHGYQLLQALIGIHVEKFANKFSRLRSHPWETWNSFTMNNKQCTVYTEILRNLAIQLKSKTELPR